MMICPLWSWRCSAFVHHENVAALLAAIFQSVHCLSHHVNSQSANWSFVERLGNVGRGSFQRIKWTTVVLHGDTQLRRFELNANLDAVLPSVRERVVENVGQV